MTSVRIVVWTLVALLGLCGPAAAQLPAFQVGATPITGTASAGDCLKKGVDGKGAAGACSAGSVTTFSGGTTGLTPSSPSAGAVVLSGTLGTANGGTGLTALGTGVPTALGVNVGSAGAVIVNGGALGAPSSASCRHRSIGTRHRRSRSARR